MFTCAHQVRKYAYRWSTTCSIGFIFSYKIIVRIIYIGVVKGRHATHLPHPSLSEAPLKVFPNHITVQYSAFKEVPKRNCNVSVGYRTFKEVPNNNCNTQVPYSALQGRPTATALCKCKYSAFKGSTIATVICNSYAFKEAHYSKCNM